MLVESVPTVRFDDAALAAVASSGHDDEEEPVLTGFGLKPVTWGDGGKVGRTGQGNWRVLRVRLGGEPGGEQTPRRAVRERMREDRAGSDLLQ